MYGEVKPAKVSVYVKPSSVGLPAWNSGVQFGFGHVPVAGAASHHVMRALLGRGGPPPWILSQAVRRASRARWLRSPGIVFVIAAVPISPRPIATNGSHALTPSSAKPKSHGETARKIPMSTSQAEVHSHRDGVAEETALVVGHRALGDDAHANDN